MVEGLRVGVVCTLLWDGLRDAYRASEFIWRLSYKPEAIDIVCQIPMNIWTFHLDIEKMRLTKFHLIEFSIKSFPWSERYWCKAFPYGFNSSIEERQRPF